MLKALQKGYFFLAPLARLLEKVVYDHPPQSIPNHALNFKRQICPKIIPCKNNTGRGR